MIKVSPSLLSADFADLGRAAANCEECNAVSIHCDVMDGSYVANITFGLQFGVLCKYSVMAHAMDIPS